MHGPMNVKSGFNPLNAELNPVCHLLALLAAHHILHLSRIRVNIFLSLSTPRSPHVLSLLPFSTHSNKSIQVGGNV